MTAASAKGWNLLRVLAFLALAGFYFAVLNARPDFSRFNAHDSEDYLALSYSLVHGLGYTQSMDPGRYLPHVTWPPGVPVPMMPAMPLSGERVDWCLVKGTMALVGLLGVVLAWYLARRVTGDPPTVDWAALALGLNPFYWDFSHQAMAEVPLTVWILGSLCLIDRCWARRAISYRAVLGVGLILGVGMMFKGHAGALLLAPLAYLFGPAAAPWMPAPTGPVGVYTPSVSWWSSHWARLSFYLLVATTTWILNRSFTFRVTGGGGKHWQWVKYVVLNAIGGGLNYGTYALLVYRFPLAYTYPVLGVVAGSAVGLVVNDSANEFLVFGRSRCEPVS